MLGLPGAVTADLLMQLLGLGSLALLLPIGMWGYRLLGHKPLNNERLRVVLWLVTAVLTAAFASCLPRSAHWPLPCGLGGVIGDAVLRVPAWFLHAPASPGQRTVLGIVIGFGALLAFLGAAGILWNSEQQERHRPDVEDIKEDDEDEGTWISLGWLAHALLSFRARLGRLLRRAGNTQPYRPAEGAAARRRIEPHRDLTAERVTAPEFDDDDSPADPVPDVVRKPRPAPKPPRRSSDGYTLPSLNLLTAPRAGERMTVSAELIEQNGAALEGVLGDFGVRGEIINARPGPVVTLYELEPAPGIKSSRVISLADDIARSMSALSARVAVVSGRNAIGIELPNPTREKVYLRELLASRDYADNSARLPLCLGKAIGGEAVLVDLARMPHLLIAGTTGSGKSVAINTMILSAGLSPAPGSVPAHHGRSQNAGAVGL